MNRYYPGQAVRSKLESSVEGVFTDPPTPSVTVRFPDGSSTTPTAVRDSVGMWHADFLIPPGMPGGIAAVLWQSTGAAIVQNAFQARRFEVAYLPAPS